MHSGCSGIFLYHCSREELKKCEGQARSLSLDLYDQWKTMEKDGKWRFTSPTHVVLAFSQALKEMEEEGGIPARHARYAENNRILIEKMEELGIRPYIEGRCRDRLLLHFIIRSMQNFLSRKCISILRREAMPFIRER